MYLFVCLSVRAIVYVILYFCFSVDHVRARVFALIRGCSFIRLCVFFFICVCAWSRAHFHVPLDLTRDTRQRNVDGASGLCTGLLAKCINAQLL